MTVKQQTLPLQHLRRPQAQCCHIAELVSMPHSTTSQVTNSHGCQSHVHNQLRSLCVSLVACCRGRNRRRQETCSKGTGSETARSGALGCNCSNGDTSDNASALHPGGVCSCPSRWAQAQDKVKKNTRRSFLSTTQQGHQQPHGGGKCSSEDQTGEVY